MYNQKYFMSAGIFYMSYITAESLIVDREFKKKRKIVISHSRTSVLKYWYWQMPVNKKKMPYSYYELQKKWPIHIFHRKIIIHSYIFFSSVLQTILVIFLTDVKKDLEVKIDNNMGSILLMRYTEWLVHRQFFHTSYWKKNIMTHWHNNH